jgi:hypothetical protein
MELCKNVECYSRTVNIHMSHHSSENDLEFLHPHNWWSVVLSASAVLDDFADLSGGPRIVLFWPS